MKGMDIRFKNRPNDDGTLSSFTIKNCLISQSGAPTTTKPRVQVHIPKQSNEKVEGAWLEYDGSTYHVVGVSAASMKENTGTHWDRYCIAEKIY